MQWRQMQARPRCASGSELIKAAGTGVCTHQQGVSKLPLHAGPQALGPPHSGQTGAGMGMAGFMA